MTSKVDPGSGGNGLPGDTISNPNEKVVWVDGCQVVVNAVDGQVYAVRNADGTNLPVPKGSRFNGQKLTVDLPGGDHLTFHNGAAVRNHPTPQVVGDLTDHFSQSAYTPPGARPVSSGQPSPSASQDNYREAHGGSTPPVARGGASSDTMAGMVPAASTTQTDPVRAFQAAHGLVVDGIVGPKTLAAGYKPAAAPAVPTPAAASVAPGSVYAAIQRAAAENGVPLALALAMAQQESGFNPHAVGDNGTSFGLYQLHRGGELGGMSQQQASDPYTNASVALKQVAAVMRSHPGADLGTIAALAQRPADPTGYASSVNGILGQAKSNPSYFSAALDNAPALPANSYGSGNIATGTGQPNVPNFDEKAFEQALRNAGFSSAVINSNLDLKQVFQQAVAKQQSVQDFLAAIQNTHWYQSRSGSQREYDQENVSDHNSLSARVRSLATSMQAQANSLGIPISALRAHDLAVTALRNGLAPEEITKSLAAEAQAYNPTTAYGGTYGAAVDQIKKSMADYNVQLDDKTIGQFAQQTAAGAMDKTKVDEFLRNQAAAKYPWLKPQLDQGFTVYQLQSPYRQELANSLEVDPGTISNNDPLLQKGMQMSDGKGGYTTMPLYLFQQAVKQDPRWMKTDNARNSLMDVGIGALKDMGLTS